MRRAIFDTNVIISAFWFPDSIPGRALTIAIREGELVLTEWIIGELHEVVLRKSPDGLPALRGFLNRVPYELVSPGEAGGISISDKDDQPILDAAIAGDVDTIVTGDKHFLQLGLTRPRVMTPREYLALPPA
ncbi:MAG: PIN domain-containing protein [Propionibacteriaceae bacterium]|nr:PIN domain-containing protein [Propionibacteriaceae bacterium]